MSDAPATLSAVFAEIARVRDGYLKNLPAELLELERLAAGLAGSELDRTVLDELHRRLHKLAGAGGTFGLPDLTARARSLEETVQAWLAGGADAVAAEDRRNVVAGIAALGTTLPNGSTPPP